jgi:hypothetical protein
VRGGAAPFPEATSSFIKGPIDKTAQSERTSKIYGVEEKWFGPAQDTTTPTSARAVALYKRRTPAPPSPPRL